MKPKKYTNWIFDDIFRDFEEEFREIEEDIARIFGEVRKVPKENKGIKPFIYGFAVNLGPDGEPRIERFSNINTDYDDKTIDDNIEPLVDVIELEKDIRVVAEIPGVSKEDINLNAGQETLEIRVDTANVRFHKVVSLPTKVMPENAKASYKNGVLEVVLPRLQESGDSSKRISIE